MKKSLLLVAVAGMAFFTSCEEKLPGAGASETQQQVAKQPEGEQDKKPEESPSGSFPVDGWNLGAPGTLQPEAKQQEPLVKSLAGTTWKFRVDSNDGGWTEITLAFTSTHATYTKTNSAKTNSTFTGTYTYDPPTVAIVERDNRPLTENNPTGTLFPQEICHKGTVKGETMTMYIVECDNIAITELQKQ